MISLSSTETKQTIALPVYVIALQGPLLDAWEAPNTETEAQISVVSILQGDQRKMLYKDGCETLKSFVHRCSVHA